MKKILRLSDSELEKILAAAIYYTKKKVSIPEEFFRTEEGKRLYIEAKISIIEDLTSPNLESLIRKYPEYMEDLNSLVSEIYARNSSLDEEYLDDKPKIPAITLIDKNNKELVIYHPTMIGIIGMNANGKTTFSLFLAKELAENYKVFYNLMEDNHILTRLREDIKKKLIIKNIKNFNSFSERIYRMNIDMVFVDALTSFNKYNIENRGYFEREIILHRLQRFIPEGRSVYIINHFSKISKREKRAFTMHDAYTGEFTNLIDMCLLVELREDTLIVRVEKNRMEKNTGAEYYFDFNNIVSEIDKNIYIEKIREIKTIYGRK